MRENPFWYPRHKRINGRIEFDAFLDAVQEEALRCTENFPRFHILNMAFGSVIPDKDPILILNAKGKYEIERQITYQINFGNRPMRRKDLDGNWATETGATLHYSLGDGGYVATSLYGFHSELGQMEEKMIFLRIGHYTAYQLKKFIERDIKDFVAYSYVSSVDTEPTWREWARVWFLRHFHPRQVNGKFESPKGNKWVGTAANFTLRTMLLVLLKPIGIALAAALLLFLGFEMLASLIS
ncbi:MULTISPECIES: hypothetical protein [Rhizobium/Agrobacterium group]|uniref:Uncharacterized protein n=1 Tax=Agrobacterium genomosp. 2 str. CFBP 5494 TaxID=1183436 RepID=A0A9W5F1N3_9HYPH|nr:MULTISPECIES: hypothetical protein [Rhizobium/Agrobacterium group]CAD7036370.1 hypothetical protein RP007_04447 [Rhizobium sp. P007]CUW88539.1 hypothetical protein AGR2A_Cc140092 [Agrobacterium genomosp. 2 str. CFBP 5494]